MKIAIDKKSISAVKPNNEYVYLFDKEPLENLLKLNMHCINYKNCSYVDINLTNYDIDCIKKAKVTDKDYDVLPKKKNYKYAIIVPNYNNNHGEYKGKTYLENCIESILNQTYKNFELIITLDNPKNIELKQLIEEYSKKRSIKLPSSSVDFWAVWRILSCSLSNSVLSRSC